MATETRNRFNRYTAPGLFGVTKEAFKHHPEEWKAVAVMVAENEQ